MAQKPPAEYVIGLLKKRPLVAAVAKFEGGDEPTSVYTVREQAGGRLSCDCSAYVYGAARPCKHGLMVSRLQRRGTL